MTISTCIASKNRTAVKQQDLKRSLSNLMFCWPCIVVYQYSKTNVMHFLLNLLRIKGLYMFRALLAHLQEAVHKRHLVYCVHVMSVGCTRIGVELQSWCSQYKQYTKCRLCSASWRWASSARNMYRPLILSKLNKKCITLVLLYWSLSNILGWGADGPGIFPA
jgi:hypothetical protein